MAGVSTWCRIDKRCPIERVAEVLTASPKPHRGGSATDLDRGKDVEYGGLIHKVCAAYIVLSRLNGWR
jgi:hypothetical protein